MTTPPSSISTGSSGVAGAPEEADAHRGSASVRLSGRSVLSAWLGSIAMHAVLFSAMLALVLPFSSEPKAPERPVTSVELVGSLDGASFMPSLASDLPTRSDELAIEVPPVPAPERFIPPAELTTAKKPDLSIVGIGVGGGDAESFGLKIGGATAPEFFGLGASAQAARTVVYVVDMSASMQDTFGIVRAELRRSISQLRRSQKFHVIFFNGLSPLENPPRRLVSAINAQKERFFDFLDRIDPSGSTEPSAALRLAINLQPDVVYLLSDGEDFPPNLLSQLDAWNQDRRVRISTIAYLNPMGRRLLETVAREHHGEFKFVSDNDLP